MPNWASTSYVVTGDKSETEDLYKKMLSLEKRKTSLVENGFGTTWLGNLIVKFGGDWNKIYCRGSWDALDYDSRNHAISFTTETAWGEMSEWRHFIEGKYKTLKFWYITEEPGMCCYQTNDRDGQFFPYHYVIEYGDSFYIERKTYEEIALDAESIIGRKLNDGEDIESAIEEWAESNDIEYYNYHEYKIVDD